MEAGQAPETPSEVVFERIKQLRANRGLSGAAIAKRMTELGIPWDRNTVAKIETGRRALLTVDELVALAHVLDTSPLVLLLPREPIDYPLTATHRTDVIAMYRWVLGRGSRPEVRTEASTSLTAAEKETAAWLAFKQEFLWLL